MIIKDFGAIGYIDFSNQKDEARKQRNLNRHKNNEIGLT